ncbi:MAG: ATP-binding cassette domain-containing protein [Oscillospiraceae bacterium]|nr:ATP-binding cassette domain-containing protein [Oscillospiraceae bacterium]
MALLSVEDLKVYFPIKGGIFARTLDYVRAVDSVSFDIEPGQTVGLIGESGSGKSTTGRAIVGLSKITAGKISFDGEDITKYVGKNRSSYRRGVQMIFQDAYSSLDPKRRVLDLVAEPLRNFEKLTKAEERRRVDELLEIVGLGPENAIKYPHEFSGGQRQRIGIARAVALKPRLIIADEPVSALDLSVQAQVLNYLKHIQQEFKLAYLFISHDLGVVKYMCDHLLIMHRGRFVERGGRADIYENPTHIYTKQLIAAIPDPDPEKKDDSMARRARINQEYETLKTMHYDPNGRVYDLRAVSDTHSVALPE